MKWISPENLAQQLNDRDDLTVVDVREPYEFEYGSLCNLNIPMDNLANEIDFLKGLKNICLVCKSGKRAEAAANFLITEFQLSNVMILEGGVQGYAKNIAPEIQISL